MWRGVANEQCSPIIHYLLLAPYLALGTSHHPTPSSLPADICDISIFGDIQDQWGEKSSLAMSDKVSENVLLAPQSQGRSKNGF